MTTTLLSRCALVATMEPTGVEIPDADIVVEDGWIRSVGDHHDDRTPDEVVDCRNMVVLPGFINTHHHLYQTLTRAFPESRGQPLFSWLRMLYPIWAGLDEEMIYISTRTGLTELALSGCTTAADHLYVFPPGNQNFMEAQARAAQEVGVRFHMTRGSMDLGERDGGLPPDSVVQKRDTILDDSLRTVERYHDARPGSMLRVGLAPCSPFSASPELMRETADLARRLDVRLHTHIAETRDEDAFSRERFDLSPVELLESLGWMDRGAWLAHCVHLSDRDIALMVAGHVGVAHCPTSNMLLGSGLAPVRRLLQSQINVGLGVDGSASNDGNDLRQEIKQATLVARVRDGADAMPVREALRLATAGGAACLGRDDIGSIQPGKAADLVLFDANALGCAGGQEDLLAAVVLGSTRPHSVMINGSWVVRDGNLVRGDIERIAAEHNRASSRLMEKWRTGSADPFL